jgi:hypothetical protein
MSPQMNKHPLVDDTIYVMNDGTRVRIHGKENDLYLVIAVRDGKQWIAKSDDFKNPSDLKF